MTLVLAQVLNAVPIPVNSAAVRAVTLGAIRSLMHLALIPVIITNTEMAIEAVEGCIDTFTSTDVGVSACIRLPVRAIVTWPCWWYYLSAIDGPSAARYSKGGQRSES